MQLVDLLKKRYGIDTDIKLEGDDTVVYFTGDKYFNFYIQSRYKGSRLIVGDRSPVDDYAYPLLQDLLKYDRVFGYVSSVSPPVLVMDEIKKWYNHQPHKPFDVYWKEQSQIQFKENSSMVKTTYVKGDFFEIVDYNLNNLIFVFRYEDMRQPHQDTHIKRVVEYLLRCNGTVLFIDHETRQITVRFDKPEIVKDPIKFINDIMRGE